LGFKNLNQPGFQNPLQKHVHKWRPLDAFGCRQAVEVEQQINLQLGEPIVRETEVGFIEAQRLSVDLSSIRTPVAVGTEGDEVVIFVSLTFRPRDNVVDINLDVPAGWNGASVARFHENSPSNVGRYWRPPAGCFVGHDAESPQEDGATQS
jgi:hypothetical protein